MERDYLFYRKRAGLNFDKFFELHPEKKDKGLFEEFIKRFDVYNEQRDILVENYYKKQCLEVDPLKYQRIDAEKMYALAQLENRFIDVLRVIFGISPDDDKALFGDTIENRYLNLVKNRICEDKPGFYLGDDGFYRLNYFYDDEEIPLSVMLEYDNLGEMAYKNECEENQKEIELYIYGKKILLPEHFRTDSLDYYMASLQEFISKKLDTSFKN